MAENHIITVTYTGCRQYTTRRLFQYDYGQEMHLEGFPLPAAFEMHFSIGQGKTVTMIGADGVVAVPDQCLLRAGTVMAWLFLHDTEDDGETRCVFEMPVDPRGAITYQEPTPVQQDTITQAITALDAAVAQTGQDVIDAEAAKAAAELAKTVAELEADAAEQSKIAAANSAVDADASRAAADVSATNAGISERNAAASAEAAQAAVDQYDDMTATATGLAAGSTPTAEIDHSGAAPVLRLGIPQGAKGDPGDPGDPTELIDDTAGEGDVTKVWSADKSATELSSVKSAINELEDDKAPVIISSASGSIASFDDGADGMPVKELTVQIEPVQSGSGDPSPENVRPITGWTGCEINQAQENLFDEHGFDALSDYPNQGSYGYMYTDIIQLSPNTTYKASVFVKDSTVISNINEYYIAVYSGYATDVGSPTLGSKYFITLGAIASDAQRTFTTGPTGKIRLAIHKVSGSSTTFEEDVENLFKRYNFQIEIGSVGSDYHPYHGTTLPITWQSSAGTVYGGADEVIGGGLKVDRAKLTNQQLLSGSYTSAGNGIFVLSISVAELPTVDNTNYFDPKLICNVLPTGTQTSLASGSTPGIAHWWGNKIGIATGDTSITTQAAFKTWLESIGAEIVYPLAESIEYTLDPVTLTTLLGTNNIWADCGPVSVDYRADTKAYVDNASPDIPVTDVQVDGQSVVQNGVANVPIASSNTIGVVRAQSNYGINVSNGLLLVSAASSDLIKKDYGTATNVEKTQMNYRPITPNNQHGVAFYGLAKAAGDSTQSASSNAVGVYTDDAKQKIQKMLGVPGGYRTVADVTLAEAVPYNNAYVIDLSDYPAREIFLFITVKASTGTTSLRLEIHNSDNLLIYGDNYGSGITTEDKTRLWDFELAGDYAIISTNVNNTGSNPIRWLGTLNAGRKHDGIYSVRIRPYNDAAEIPVGSTIRLFAK